jgi:hypothetical protein
MNLLLWTRFPGRGTEQRVPRKEWSQNDRRSYDKNQHDQQRHETPPARSEHRGTQGVRLMHVFLVYPIFH